MIFLVLRDSRIKMERTLYFAIYMYLGPSKSDYTPSELYFDQGQDFITVAVASFAFVDGDSRGIFRISEVVAQMYMNSDLSSSLSAVKTVGHVSSGSSKTL